MKNLTQRNKGVQKKIITKTAIQHNRVRLTECPGSVLVHRTGSLPDLHYGDLIPFSDTAKLFRDAKQLAQSHTASSNGMAIQTQLARIPSLRALWGWKEKNPKVKKKKKKSRKLLFQFSKEPKCLR